MELALKYMLKQYNPVRPRRSLGSGLLVVPRIKSKQAEEAFSHYAPRIRISHPLQLLNPGWTLSASVRLFIYLWYCFNFELSCFLPTVYSTLNLPLCMKHAYDHSQSTVKWCLDLWWSSRPQREVMHMTPHSLFSSWVMMLFQKNMFRWCHSAARVRSPEAAA